MSLQRSFLNISVLGVKVPAEPSSELQMDIQSQSLWVSQSANILINN